MKKYFLLSFILPLLLISGCSKDDDKNDDPKNDSYESTLTVTINGDGFNNETFVYTGVEDDATNLWAVRYYKGSDVSTAQLYLDPVAGNHLSAPDNGLVNVCFSGKSTITENIIGDGITTLLYPWNGRGIDIQIRKPDEDISDIYSISDGITTGTITVTEYGSRVKGSFNMLNLVKFLESSTTINISGTFDLAYLGEFDDPEI